MIYIGTGMEGGCGLYLDVRMVERTRLGVRLSAVIGDGQFEGEVLVDFGRSIEITFVDSLWGHDRALRQFLAAYGEEKICSDLRQALSSYPPPMFGDGASREARPHNYMPLFDNHGTVAEGFRA